PPEGRPGTRALTRSYLVRHGAAGDRHAWHEADELRPLDEEGRWQAEALVALLAEAVIERLLSSPYLRCVQTLEPLAAVRGTWVFDVRNGTIVKGVLLIPEAPLKAPDKIPGT